MLDLTYLMEEDKELILEHINTLISRMNATERRLEALESKFSKVAWL